MNFFSILGVIVFGVLEFLGMTYILKYSFLAISNHNVTMLSCGALIVFLMWLGKKINNMAQPKQEDTKNES